MSRKFYLPGVVSFELPDDVSVKSRLSGTVNTTGGGNRRILLLDRTTMEVIGGCLMDTSDNSWKVYARVTTADNVLALYLDDSGQFNASVVDHWDLCQIVYSPGSSWNANYVYPDRAKFQKTYYGMGYKGTWLTDYDEAIQDIKGNVAQLQIDTLNTSGHFEDSGGIPNYNSNIVTGSITPIGDVSSVSAPGTNDDDIGLTNLTRAGYLFVSDIFSDGSDQVFLPMIFDKNDIENRFDTCEANLDWQDEGYSTGTQAPYFNGLENKRSFINLDWHVPLTDNQEFTFSCLLKITSGEPERGCLLHISDTIAIYVYNSDVYVRLNTSTSSRSYSGATTWDFPTGANVSDGAWVHIVVSLSSSVAKLWINGVYNQQVSGDARLHPYSGDDQASFPRSTWIGSSELTANGSSSTHDTFYGSIDGFIQHVRIFNRSLTGDSEALTLYNDAIGTTPGEIYPIDSIVNIYDNSGYQLVSDATSQWSTVALDNKQTDFAPFLGDAPDSFTADVTTAGSAYAYFAFSFDNKQTYRVWDGSSAWRAIASKDPAVHGVGGDTDWYYRDNASVWSKSGISGRLEALSTAINGNANNQNNYTTINSLTNTEWEGTDGFDDTVGYLDMSMTFNKATTSGEVIDNINIDDTKYWYSPVIDLEAITDEIDWSNVSWSYGRNLDMSDADFNEFKDNLKVYVIRTGDTAWTECTNDDTIPGIVNGYTTTGIEIQFRMTHDPITSSYTVNEFWPELYVEIN